MVYNSADTNKIDLYLVQICHYVIAFSISSISSYYHHHAKIEVRS